MHLRQYVLFASGLSTSNFIVKASIIIIVDGRIISSGECPRQNEFMYYESFILKHYPCYLKLNHNKQTIASCLPKLPKVQAPAKYKQGSHDCEYRKFACLE